MPEKNATPDEPLQREAIATYREAFERISTRFLSEADFRGTHAIAARSEAADALVRTLWRQCFAQAQRVPALLATGGYGRQQLFPFSDLDLLFLLEDETGENPPKQSIRRFTQQLWDCGIRVAATTRALADSLRFDPQNAEFALSAMDARFLAGNERLAKRFCGAVPSALSERDRKQLTTSLLEMTRERHARYGDTIFHLEPNVKECPGGLRDANVCGWLAQLHATPDLKSTAEFERAFAFLASVRCFLHLRQGRDVNALDWKAQDAAAAEGIGVDGGASREPAYWMQLYFRYARSVARRLEQQIDALPQVKPLLRVPEFLRKRARDVSDGFRVESGRLVLDDPHTGGGRDAAQDFESVMRAFESVAESGLPLSKASEDRIEEALPLLSSQMEVGEPLWRHLERILCGGHAGAALRSMHAQGLLELMVPEFHGIDALVIRDAYHRYTVDEHTFVLIDTLHGLGSQPLGSQPQGSLSEWAGRFAVLLKDLQHPGLLYLAALLHDTGKGRASGEHTVQSARLAEGVLRRLERDAFESGLVLHLISNHLEMSAALRRDIFDAETVRAFAAKVQAPDELRMLTLFTYADINAVHPDALTPWKAENLWRLYIATANYLDRNVDDERVDARVSSDLVHRIISAAPQESRDLMYFLEGFPQRYLQTRSPEQIRSHYAMTRRLSADVVQLDLAWRADRSEITLVTPDRRLLFARVAGVLASWGMNIITADAFSNAQGIVVDSFRFTDDFRTLELNPGERDRLRQSIHDAVNEDATAEKSIAARRRGRRRDPLLVVTAAVKFDTRSSSHSTLMQVVAQDHPGLLYAISQTLGEERCNIEVALIDTEGDTAIDVFYLTRDGRMLDEDELPSLKSKLLEAIAANAT